MAEKNAVKNYIAHSEVTKAFKHTLWGHLLITLLGGIAAVILMPMLDNAITGGEQPGAITVVGTGLTISLLTLYLIKVNLREHFYGNKVVLGYMLFYNILIVLVKFTLSPLSLYKANPTLVQDNGNLFGGLISGNFNGNILSIAVIAFVVLLLYLIVFTVLKKVAIWSINKRLKLKSKSTRKKISIILSFIIGAVCIFAAGAMLLFPLILFASSFSGGFIYLSYIFSTLYSGILAIIIITAAASAGVVFLEAERHTVLNRNLNLFITVVWTGIGLLLVFHIIWAVYLFILTTLWPFKVVTVTSK